MPYIPKADRERAALRPRNPGELNYAITHLLLEYLNATAYGYTHMNDCLGALEGAKLEFYRRVMAPYEESKIKSAGDVYPT